MNILVVDDDPRVREICIRLLRSAGHEAEAAESGDAAAARLGEGFEIVLTDLDMPGSLDGNALTRRVRASGSADVIIMTASPELETAVQAIRDGAYDYLIKPFGAETLKNAVERCAVKRSLSRELATEKALRAELARTAMVREIFGQFATPEVVRIVLDHPEDFRKRGERRVVTVLFADVRGFTPFAGRVSPEEAVSALNGIFGSVLEAVRSEGGILNKFIGDGVMALFGAPIPAEDHARAAARAAIKARREVEAMAEERRRLGLEPLRIGVGLNSGEVVAGCLGTKERTEYSVIGHAVNVAARLEESAGPGQILVGPETARLLGAGFKLLGPQARRLPGVPEPVEAFELESCAS